jgi:hypothetical protein
MKGRKIPAFIRKRGRPKKEVVTTEESSNNPSESEE